MFSGLCVFLSCWSCVWWRCFLCVSVGLVLKEISSKCRFKFKNLSRLNKHTKLNIFFICTQIFYYYYFSPFLFPDVWKLKEMFAAVSHLTERSLTASCLDFLFRAVGWYSKLSVSFSAGKNTCQGLNMATDSDSWVHSVYISKSKNRAKAGILSIFQQGKGFTCKEA